MSYNLVDPTTGDLTRVAGGIDTSIIPSNASASNKLVTQNDALIYYQSDSSNITDFNNAVPQTGKGAVQMFYLGSDITNAPTSSGGGFIVIAKQLSTTYISQLATQIGTNNTYTRSKSVSGWSSWADIITSNNIGSQTVARARTADKTVNDITINIPFVQEGGEYVIPLGNILEPTSIADNSPYNWDIAGFFSIIRPSGHNGSHIKFEAGHGYSHAWVTYAYLDKEDFNLFSTSIKVFQYNGEWWMGLCLHVQQQGYLSKMTITFSRGLPATPTCILYNSRSGGIVNEEIYNSIQDIPSSWWRTRTIYNPTTFTQNITAPNITSLEERVTALESKLQKASN